MASVQPVDSAVLVGYYDAVATRTHDLLSGVTTDELDRVVNERWVPPATLGVRLISILNDDTQHVGQAAYVRELIPG